MSDWEVVSDSESDWEIAPLSKDAEEVASLTPEPKSFNIFGSPEEFKNQLDDFYSKYGVYGANKAFSKLFGTKKTAELYGQKAKEAAKKYPIATKTGEILASGYSSIPFFMAGGGVARNALPAASPFAHNVVGGILGGGGMGAISTPEEGESRLGNTITDAAVGAVVPGVAKGIGYGAQKLLKAGKFLAGETGKTLLDPLRITYPKIAESAEKSVSNLINKGSEKFTNVFNKATNAGFGELDKIKINPSTMKGLRKFAGKDDYNEALARFFKNRSLDNAKKLSSDLFKFTKKYEKLPLTSKTSEGNLAYKAALNFRSTLENNIKSNLKKAGGDALVSSYEGANKFWSDEVVGPQSSNLLKKFQAGKVSPKDFVKKITQTEEGRATLKSLVPEATYRAILNNALRLGLLGGGAIYGAGKALDKLGSSE